jgi:hypothetical protein
MFSDWKNRRPGLAETKDALGEVEECVVLRASALQKNIESTMVKTIIDKG